MNDNRLFTPKLVNLEITLYCPLKCSQCFCADNKNVHIELNKAKSILLEARDAGVEIVNLSGGETLCYPHLNELIAFIKRIGMTVNIATSGYGLSKYLLADFIKLKLDGIFISLNGSHESINQVSRDGFKYAIEGIKLIAQDNHIPFKAINWVMNRYNISDFPNMVNLAEENRFDAIYVVMLKRDKSSSLSAFPSSDNIGVVVEYIKQYKGDVRIVIDSCFSQLKSILGDWGLGNSNVGVLRGCSAGVDSYAVDINGLYMPCRHINLKEKRKTLLEYWNESSFLNELRVRDNQTFRCKRCKYREYCKPCAVNQYGIDGRLYAHSNENDFLCPVFIER